MDALPGFAVDVAAVARGLAAISEQADDLVDAFFERSEEVTFRTGGDQPGLEALREEGLAVRLVREGRTWLASRDEFSGRAFAEASRQVARLQPRAALPEPLISPEPWPEVSAPELPEFARTLERALRAQLVAFPLRLVLRRHRRALQVVGPRLVPEAERECFWSATGDMPWGRAGALFSRLDGAAAEGFAESLAVRFRARAAPAPAAQRGMVVLGPAAAAVFLHEAVAHALEVDLLARSGQPAAALGVEFGAPCLDVLDDPGAAPEGVRRATDDEGQTVLRRWLLRAGVVEQPIADSLWAASSPALSPGAGRRANRHLAPGPRSTHLELLAGPTERQALCAGDGLFLAEAERGALDPGSGAFTLHFASGRRLRGGEPGEVIGPCRVRGRLVDLLHQVVDVGSERVTAGAGWCAKGGHKLPVWATAPALRLEGVEIESGE